MFIEAFRNISSEELLRIILIESVEFKVGEPVKHFRRSKLYTIKNHTLESITCDNNSAYIKSNNIKKHYVTLHDGNTLSAKKVHQHNEQYFIKERENYSNTLVNEDSIHIAERYYCYNKSIPDLKRMVVRVQNAKTKQCEPYKCVIYSLKMMKASNKLKSRSMVIVNRLIDHM